MKVVGIFSLASGALLHFSRGTQYVHESQLFVKLWPHLLKGDVVLGDRGFCSFLALGSLLAKGVHSVMRLHQPRLVDFRREVIRSVAPGIEVISAMSPSALPYFATPERGYS